MFLLLVDMQPDRYMHDQTAVGECWIFCWQLMWDCPELRTEGGDHGGGRHGTSARWLWPGREEASQEEGMKGRGEIVSCSDASTCTHI